MQLAAPQSAKTGAIIGVCFLIAMLEGYDIQAFGVAAPKLAAELHLDAVQDRLGGKRQWSALSWARS